MPGKSSAEPEGRFRTERNNCCEMCMIVQEGEPLKGGLERTGTKLWVVHVTHLIMLLSPLSQIDLEAEGIPYDAKKNEAECRLLIHVLTRVSY